MNLLHMGTNQHLAQGIEITVFFVFNVNHAPRVLSSTDCFTADLNFLVGTDTCEGDLGQDFLVFLRSLGIVVFVAGVR
jgi:nitric oxide reductase large subunit